MVLDKITCLPSLLCIDGVNKGQATWKTKAVTSMKKELWSETTMWPGVPEQSGVDFEVLILV